MDEANRSKTRSLIKIESFINNVNEIDDYITNKFDYVIKSDLYNYNGKCLIYDIIRQISLDKQNKLKRPLIFLSSDTSTCSASLAGSAERNMTRSSIIHNIEGKQIQGIDFSSDIKVLYISSSLSMCEYNISNYETDTETGKMKNNILDCQNSIMSNVMGCTKSTYTSHNVNINPANVIYLGIHDELIANEERNFIEMLSENKPTIFTLNDIRQKGIGRIMNFVKKKFNSGSHSDNKVKVHVIFDMSVIDVDIAPSVFRYDVVSNRNNKDDSDNDNQNKFDGLNREEIGCIMKEVANFRDDDRLESFDLVGYYLSTIDKKESMYHANILTIQIMREILGHVANFNEKKINIFTEESNFLIWKPLPNFESQYYDPVGWYILRNTDIDTRNKLIEYFCKKKFDMDSIDDMDDIDDLNNDNDDDELKEFKKKKKLLSFPIERFEFQKDHDDLDNDNDDEQSEPIDALISVTSPAEQNLLSYYTSKSYTDRCLVPSEKVSMVMEMLTSTPTSISTSENK